MMTRKEREQLEARTDNPAIMDMLRDWDKVVDKKLKLTYPDGRTKIIDASRIDTQKVTRYCAEHGVKVELFNGATEKQGAGND